MGDDLGNDIKLRARAEADLSAVLDAVRVSADARSAVARGWDQSAIDSSGGPVLLIAIGKASLEMADAAAARLGHRLARGVVTAVPERIERSRLPRRLRVMPADHPLPTLRNQSAAETIAAELRAFALESSRDGLVLALLSGGGSAHLAWPWEGLTLDDLREMNTLLQRSGAPIGELNSVRKHTERLKGGRLAGLSAPARVEVLVLSDVVGDPLDVIASGPFAPDPTTFGDAARVLEARGLSERLPKVMVHLRRGLEGLIDENPKPGDPCFHRVAHRVLANNESAVNGAAESLRSRRIEVVASLYGVVGESGVMGRAFARSAIDWFRRTRVGGRTVAARPGPMALVWGGETSVSVGNAAGTGGPNQEFAISAIDELLDEASRDTVLEELARRAAILAYSTDGIDGPTPAAGAKVLPGAIGVARTSKLDLKAALRSHDSSAALKAIGALLMTGPTGTNVNHISVIVFYPST